MTNLRDFGVGTLSCVALLLCGTTTADAATTVRIERSVNGAVAQDIAARHVQFYAAQNKLVVDSVSGDRRCGGAATGAAGKAGTLVLDGISYAIDTHDFSTGARTVTVRPQLNGGTFPMCVTQALMGGSVAKGETQLEARLDVEVNGNANGRAVMDITGDISYDPFFGDGMISVPIADDIICMSDPDAPGVQLELIDGYGVESTHLGLAGVDFYPTGGDGFPSGTVVLEAGPGLHCLALPTQIRQVTELAEAKGADSCNTIEDRLFAGTFGDALTPGPQVAPPGVELKVGIDLEQFPTVPEGSDEPMIYTMNVTNCGAETVERLAIRDLFPRKDAAPPKFRGANAWECVENCRGSGNAYIRSRNIGSLEPGQTLRVRASRELKDSEGTAGQFVKLAVAAWATDGSNLFLPGDNVVAYNIQVKTTNNEPPTVAITGAPAAINEDAPLAILEAADGQPAFTIAANDPEGAGIQSVAVTPVDPTQVRQVLVDDTDPQNVVVQVRPGGDQFGAITFNVVATDAEGTPSTPRQFVLDVNSVNDPPRFTVFGEFSAPAPGNTADPDVGPGTCSPSDAGCADQVWPQGTGNRGVLVKSFIASADAGAANENGVDTWTYTVEVLSGAGVFAGPTFEPRITTAGTLSYGLSGESGTAQIRINAVDDGGTAFGGDDTSDDLLLDITVQ